MNVGLHSDFLTLVDRLVRTPMAFVGRNRWLSGPRQELSVENQYVGYTKHVFS